LPLTLQEIIMTHRLYAPTAAALTETTHQDMPDDAPEGAFLASGGRLELVTPRTFFVRQGGAWIEMDRDAWHEARRAAVWQARATTHTSEWLAEWRAQMGGSEAHPLTQEQLAEILGVSVRAVKGWEKDGSPQPYLWRALRDWEAHRYDAIEE
jgi:hypothetical protein